MAICTGLEPGAPYGPRMQSYSAMTSRALVVALATAMAVGACDGSAPSPEAERQVPVADTEATALPPTTRPVVVEAPSGVDAAPMEPDVFESGTGAPAGPGHDAAVRYMARGAAPAADAVPAMPAPDVDPAERQRSEPRPGAEAGTRVAMASPDEPATSPRAEAAPAESIPAPAAPIATVATAERDPAQARDLNRRGIALINAGQPRQAIPVLERAVARAPRDPELLGNLGYAYMLAGRHEQARAHLLTALDIAPTRSATWLNLGQTYAELGQREKALDAVLRGYRYSSRKPSVRSALQRAAAGDRHSDAWRTVAGTALTRIGARQS